MRLTKVQLRARWNHEQGEGCLIRPSFGGVLARLSGSTGYGPLNMMAIVLVHLWKMLLIYKKIYD